MGAFFKKKKEKIDRNVRIKRHRVPSSDHIRAFVTCMVGLKAQPLLSEYPNQCAKYEALRMCCVPYSTLSIALTMQSSSHLRWWNRWFCASAKCTPLTTFYPPHQIQPKAWRCVDFPRVRQYTNETHTHTHKHDRLSLDSQNGAYRKRTTYILYKRAADKHTMQTQIHLKLANKHVS